MISTRWARRSLGCLLLAAAVCSPAWAQASHRIAMVLPRPPRNTEAAFQNFLRNRAIPVEYILVEFSGKPEDAPALVAQLRALKPDLIYTWGVPTTLAVAGPARTETPELHIRDTPIVFVGVADPLAVKLLEDLDRPGRNLSGVSDVAPLAAQMRALRSYAEVRKLGYITNARDPVSRAVRKELGQLSDQLGFELVDETVPFDASGQPDASQLRQTIARVAARGADFLYIGPGALLSFTLRDVVTKAALDAKLPTFCATENAAGGMPRCLFGLLASGPNAGRFAALKAAQVLAERKPIASLPVESLQRFSLFINMSTALALGAYPPIELLDVAELVH